MVDYPALTFPTGLSVDADKDSVEQGFTPLNEEDKAVYELCEQNDNRLWDFANALLGRLA